MNDKSVPSEKEFWQTMEGMVKELVKDQMESMVELERAIKKKRRWSKPQEGFPSTKAAEKVLYLRTKERNNKWGSSRMRGFKKAKPKLEERFADRYEERRTTRRTDKDQGGYPDCSQLGRETDTIVAPPLTK